MTKMIVSSRNHLIGLTDQYDTSTAGVAAGAPQGGDITVRYGGGVALADVVTVRAG